MGSRRRPRTGRRAAHSPLPTGSRDTGSRDTGFRADGGPALPGRAARRKLARKVRRKRRRSAIKEVPLLIGVAVLIALVLKTFLVQAFVIPSGSMEQTIKVGDRVLVDKLTPWFGSEPQRGDVVVFEDPGGWLQQEQGTPEEDPVVLKQIKQGLTFIGLLPSDDEQDLIKRVVGIGGDRVRCCDEDGRVTVNGVAIDEPYLHPGDAPSKQEFDVRVPEGRLFVLGDHRSNSADSRAHIDEGQGGTIAADSVVGEAVVIAWPIGNWRGLEERSTYAAVPEGESVRGGATGAAGTSHKVSRGNFSVAALPPTPAELPLVMGVVGLRLAWRGQRRETRSGCGGCGRRRTIRTRRTRG
ncbi:signal peptidase I [Streptomyces sp. KLOTTS4A1]|uniref:signal peptidase I n=1 Tax=Streptomyces sp. KLOTTS4A1 TaxID=3390996 RepID=UPI0039F53F84